MTTNDTPINRQPAGVPTGGQFAHGSHAEPSAVVLPLTEVHLAPGEDDEFDHLADGYVMDSLHVHRNDHDGYYVTAARRIEIPDLVSAEDMKMDETEHASWVDKHDQLIRGYLAERYGADVVEAGEDSMEIQFTAEHPGDTLTEAEAMRLGWEETKIVQFHNESDPGTFGSENLNRLIMDTVDASTIIPDHHTLMSEAHQLANDRRFVDSIVSLRSGEREIPDAAAMAIARNLATDNPGKYPALAKLGYHGHTDTKAMQHLDPQRRRQRMTINDAPISRQPAGVPTGGQFAPGTHPESSVTL
ncbi:hypothetical protein [Arthrobacter sp. HLT1-21]